MDAERGQDGKGLRITSHLKGLISVQSRKTTMLTEWTQEEVKMATRRLNLTTSHFDGLISV